MSAASFFSSPPHRVKGRRSLLSLLRMKLVRNDSEGWLNCDVVTSFLCSCSRSELKVLWSGFMRVLAAVLCRFKLGLLPNQQIYFCLVIEDSCGNKWQDWTRNQWHVNPLLPSPSAEPWQSHFHISDPFPLFWRSTRCQFVPRLVTVNSEVRGQANTKAAGACGRGDGLTFHRSLSRFVYGTLSFAFLPLIKGRQAKTALIVRGGQGGIFYLCAGPGGVFVKVSGPVREELRWGTVWLAGSRWECCLSLFDVPGPFCLMPSIPSGLFALQKD